MLNDFTENSKQVWLYSTATDMRKSIDALTVIIAEQIAAEVSSGDLFVFYNKQRDKIKIIFYQTNGFCIFYKRLEKQKFHIPDITIKSKQITYQQLRWIMDGLDITNLEGHKAVNYSIFY